MKMHRALGFLLIGYGTALTPFSVILKDPLLGLVAIKAFLFGFALFLQHKEAE